ncbi:MAG: hypothetical protein LBR81_04475 [Prevotellaceae bacterium]|nr:hypothetical protein [Prevotellaceae bacterium]
MNPFSSDIFLSEEICVTKYNEISADNIYFPLTETTYNVTDAILPDNLFAAMALSDPDDPNNPGNDPISQAPVGNIPFLAVFIASLAYIAVKKRDKLSRKV